MRKPRGSVRLKIALALGVAVSVGGGYLVFDKWIAKPSSAGSESADLAAAADVAKSDADGATAPDSAGDKFDDPFDDSPKMEGTASSTTPNKRPRLVGSVDDASPIDGKRKGVPQPRKNPAAKRLDLDDEPELDISDSSEPPAMSQSEPDLDDDASGPAIGIPETPRRPAAAARSKTGSGRDRSSRPRITPKKNPLNELPDDLSDEQLDGYSVAATPRTGKDKKSASTPAISIVEVRDDPDQEERLEGFVAEDVTTRRAVSKTVVIRPTEGTAPESAPLAPGLDDDALPPQSIRRGTPAAQRRLTPTPPPADGRLMSIRTPASGAPKQGPTSSSDSYRVAAEDNFWKISRKVYGTSRYFQALARHNQDRVGDPQKLRPGMQISTPPASLLEQRYPDLIEKPAPGSSDARFSDGVQRKSDKPAFADDSDSPSGQASAETGNAGYFYSRTGEPMYRVGRDDTLTGIAQRHLGRASRWQEIYEMNGDVLKSADDLTLGTVIRLPGDASRLSLVPDGERRR